MVTKDICDTKKNGIFYTPGPLAESLVNPLIHSPKQKIFDPAFGNGSLLVAAHTELKNHFAVNNPGEQLYGCDLNPGDITDKSLFNTNLIKTDFFDFPIDNQYDVILMNPPYVRHYLIKPAIRDKYARLLTPTYGIKGRSDLWAYFLIKAVMHLKRGGSIGAILPWSFLQADYAQKIRSWLLDKFKEIDILALSTEYFAGTEERILLIWLKNFDKKTESIKISFSRDLEDNRTYMELDKKVWQSSPVAVSDRHDIETIIQNYIETYNFLRFREIAEVRIGVVTGADKFFILPEQDIKKIRFPEKQLIPILSSAREFSDLHLNGKDPLKRLIKFSKDTHTYETRYIKEGEKLGFDQRAHSQRRTPWYSVDVGKTPDAFFPYRMATIPYLMLNNNKTQCTNSIHRIYFKDLSENEKKWIQVSLLAITGQLSIESYSKTYGRGVLKVEPKALKNSIVYRSNDPDINSVYPHLSTLISSGDKNAAMTKATEFLFDKLKIKKTHYSDALSALIELQNRRLYKHAYN